MHIYQYSDLVQVPAIAESISEKVPQDAVILVRGRHFYPSEDHFPLELSKKLKKDEVRLGYEILPESFTTASKRERKKLFEHIYSSSELFGGKSVIKHMFSPPKNVKLYGLRPLPYTESKGLITDFENCLEHYSKMYKKDESREIQKRIYEIEDEMRSYIEMQAIEFSEESLKLKGEELGRLYQKIEKLESPEEKSRRLRNNELYVPGVDLDKIYAAQILENRIDIAVFGAIHIEAVREKLDAHRTCVKLLQKGPDKDDEYAGLIQNPDIIIEALTSA